MASQHIDPARELQQIALQHAARHGRIVLADLIHAVKTERSAQILVAMLAFCILFWNVPLISTLLYPLKLFVTMIHESCHVLVARLTGATINSMSISPDESGLTQTIGGFRPLVACAGYTGTAIFGGLMIWLGREPKAARSVLRALGWILLSLTIFYGSGGFFSFIWMLIISGGILYASKKASTQHCHLLLLMLAVITTIEAFIDFRILTSVALQADVRTDASNLAQVTGIPRTIWTLFFGSFSLVVLFLSFWLSYRPAVRGKKASVDSDLAEDQNDDDDDDDDDTEQIEEDDDTNDVAIEQPRKIKISKRNRHK
jgi:hypothetical protein